MEWNNTPKSTSKESTSIQKIQESRTTMIASSIIPNVVINGGKSKLVKIAQNKTTHEINQTQKNFDDDL